MTDYDRRKVLAASGTALAIGVAGCLGGGGGGNGGDNGSDNGGDSSPEDTADAYLSDNSANGYSGTGDIVDETGSDAVTVDVGVGNQGYAFDPAALRVDSGTEVTWEWTGNGGSHNVVSNEAPTELDSGSAVAEAGTTYAETLEETGVYRYQCGPHSSLGMHGAVIVE